MVVVSGIVVVVVVVTVVVEVVVSSPQLHSGGLLDNYMISSVM